jgi:hypothetical protein
MNYGFHPAAEAEYLEQIAFYEALSGAKCNDPSARRHTLPSSAGILARAHYLDEAHVERQSADAARRLSSGQVFHVVLLTRS